MDDEAAVEDADTVSFTSLRRRLRRFPVETPKPLSRASLTFVASLCQGSRLIRSTTASQLLRLFHFLPRLSSIYPTTGKTLPPSKASMPSKLRGAAAHAKRFRHLLERLRRPSRDVPSRCLWKGEGEVRVFVPLTTTTTTTFLKYIYLSI